jgi:UMF1 family MFS transporter
VNTRTPYPVSNRERWAWCLYDFANSSFTTLIVTVAYSVYFVQVVAGHLGGGQAERVWFWGYALSMLAIAVASPIVGAAADRHAVKKPLLILCTLACVGATALLAMIQAGDIVAGLLLFGLANVAFELGFMLCSAFLVEIATPETMGRLSGYGWGLGYAGGLLSLAVAYPFIAGGFVADNLARYRLSFVVTAVFFLIAALPTFVWLRERAAPRIIAAQQAWWKAPFAQMAETARRLVRYRDLSRYFLAYLLYTDAINTVITASAIFANKVLDFSPGDLIIYFLVTQVTAGAGAVWFGQIADRVGPKRTIVSTLVIWTGVVAAAALVTSHAQFYAVGLVAGAALGANQATSRTLVAHFTPVGRQGEFFGLFSVTGKFAAIIGPIAYGEITAWTGSQRWAVASMAIFFASGWWLIRQVDERRGMEAAARLD